LTPLSPNYQGETALRYRTPEGGEIGIIASVTKPFCAGCTRARITAEGRLFTCLFSNQGYDLRAPLRSGAGDGEIADLIRGIWMRRDDRYSEQRTDETAVRPKAEMSLLGG
jgi:cyclic pyranopterin phosphate synthase